MKRVITFLMNNLNFIVEEVKWKDYERHLRHIRTLVFIDEQNVPEELEWDEEDQDCVHVIVKINNDYVATARLLASGQIGRMAVLKENRNTGIGSKMLESLLSIAGTMGMKTVFLNSQIDAVNFYKKFGFQEEGDVFDDAGIPHLRMHKTL
jgi:predicted GNAT family N-acyltransferase